MKARIGSIENYTCSFPKGYGRALGTESVSESHANEAIVYEDFLLLGSACNPIRCSRAFYKNFEFSCTSWCRMQLFRSANLSERSLLARVVQLLMFSLNTTSCIISTRRFILKDVKLPSLPNSGVLHSIPVAMEGGRGLPPLWGTSGRVARPVIGSIARCLQSW
jgi:hypothetical protein